MASMTIEPLISDANRLLVGCLGMLVVLAFSGCVVWLIGLVAHRIRPRSSAASSRRGVVN